MPSSAYAPRHINDLRRLSMTTPAILATCLALATGSVALPVDGLNGKQVGHNEQLLFKRAIVAKRDDGGSSGKTSVLIPAIVVPVLLVIFALVYVYRRRSASARAPNTSSSTTALNPTASTTSTARNPATSSGGNRSFWTSLFSGMGTGMGVVSPAGVVDSNGPRELTAEQLAGGTEPRNAATPATTARRTRRPRRTPSQISTVSLPVYMKEPGEQELVIFRGPEDMEDAADAVTIHMPPLSEDADQDASRSSHDHEEYGRVPDTPHDLPLLDNHDDGDESASGPPGEGMPVRNIAHSPHSSADASGGDEQDPRGAAPAYFEVSMDDAPSEDTAPQAPTVEVTPTAADTPVVEEPTATSAPARRSMTFRNLFGALGNARSNYRSPYGAGASANATRHRQNQSSGGSLLSAQSHSTNSHYPPLSGSPLNLSRTRSRSIISRTSRPNTPTANELTSPSMISLNSISSPLSHTLVRTEFTYPKSGPTPEQLKLISSRESFSRFGKPYGEDAVRWASQSRLGLHDENDVDDLPPEFDEPSGSRARPRAGPGHRRNESSTSLLPAPNTPYPAEPALGQALQADVTPPLPTTSTPVVTTSEPAVEPPTPEAESMDTKPESSSPKPESNSPQPESSSSQPESSPSEPESLETGATTTTPAIPVSPTTPSTTLSPPASTSTATSTTTSAPPSSFPISTAILKRASTTSLGHGLPPGAAPPMRSVSRASTVSVASYATAAESMRTVTPTGPAFLDRREGTEDTVRAY